MMWKDSLAGLKHWPEESCLLGYSPGGRLVGPSSCSISALLKPAGATFVFSIFFLFLFLLFSVFFSSFFSFPFLSFFFSIFLCLTPTSGHYLHTLTSTTHQKTSISWRGASTHVWCPVFLSLVTWFLWLPPRGCPLITWLWRPGELSFLGPMGL